MLPFVAMRTPALHLLAALSVAACGSNDASCGFRDHSYQATFVLVGGPCRYEPPRVASWALPPAGCTQQFSYHECDPTVRSVCKGGAVTELVALQFTDTGYRGTAQDTYQTEVPPVICTYAVELTQL